MGNTVRSRHRTHGKESPRKDAKNANVKIADETHAIENKARGLRARGGELNRRSGCRRKGEGTEIKKAGGSTWGSEETWTSEKEKFHG